MQYESTPPNVEALITQYQMSGDVALREQLATMHLYIANIVARKFSRRGVEYDDLYQVASLALLKAIERFDASKGIKFSSFATPTMVGEVKNYFRDRSRLITLPRRGSELMKRIRTTWETLEQQLMRSPTPVELAEALDTPLDTVLEALEMQGAAAPTSLDTAALESETSPLDTFLGIEDTGYRHFEQSDQVTRLLEQLDPDEREVLIKRYYRGESQRVVAEQMGISQMTVSRLERRALEKSRRLLGSTESEGQR
ncbi:MAG: sigma-70 family RNA polymerase sigma factor [Clostridia bacterium]